MTHNRKTNAWQNYVRLAAYPIAIFVFFILRADPRMRSAAVVDIVGCFILIELILHTQTRSRAIAQAMRLIRHEHELFRAAAEGSQQAFYAFSAVCDANQRVIDFQIAYLNAAAERLFERKRLELIGQSAALALPQVPKLQLMSVWSRVAATGISETMQIPLDETNTEMIAAHVAALPDGVGVTLMNSVDEEATRRLREVNDFAHSIIQSAPIGIIATDLNGTIVAMNSAAERLTLYRRHDLVGQHSLVILHDPAELSARAVQLTRQLDEPIQAGFHSLIALAAKGHPEAREWTGIRKDGSRVSINLTMSTLRTADGRITGYLATSFDIAERKELVDSVVHMAHHDQLTGLPNRVLLNDRIAGGIERSRRFNQNLAVFMIDIDHFKRINDSLGHAAGDMLLTLVARQLLSAVRRTDTVARVGGDEFVVLMPDFHGLEDAERCASLMLQKISMPQIIGNREVRVSASIGYCLYPDSASTPEELLRNADIAMYEAKSHGRSHARAFSGEMARVAAVKLEMEQDMRSALDNGEFSLHYQPQILCATGEVIGMEGLLRWESPKRGSVSPAEFIPVAEESGLLIQIGEWVVRQACFDCMAAEASVGKPLAVAINLSPRQFNQHNLREIIEAALRDSGLPAKRLEIEITEQLLMANTANILATLEGMRDLGISVAIDDFGTGFSSLAYVMQYKVDRLKIDQSFIAKSMTDPAAASVVRTIIAMAHGLKIDVVAEGVETVDQLSFLLRKRCDVVQGYLFSRPVRLQEFATAVTNIQSWVMHQRRLAAQTLEARTPGATPNLQHESWQASMISQA
jgi:diguanylate cyclase (GGDEF)-like protein/PAS domain S-box-containing protein